MQKLFQTSAWIVAVLFTVGMVGLIGCGGDEEETAVTPQLTAVNPPDGSEVFANGKITLTFDNAPESVTVNGVDVAVAGKTVTVDLATLNLSEGSQTLSIAWTGGDGGSSSVTYTVKAPDTEPPTLASSTINDGDENVEYDGLVQIKLTFSEPLDTTKSRNITIAPEGGDPLNWSISWEDDDATAVLDAGKGGELTAETTYVITAKNPTDKAGNSGDDVVITFTTRAKE